MAHGGGVHIGFALGDLTITDSTFIGNNAYYGGAISAGYSTALTVSGSTIVNNVSYRGGGLYFIDNDFHILNSTIASNLTYETADAIFSYRPSCRQQSSGESIFHHG